MFPYIQISFVFIQFAMVGLYDTIQVGAEKMYWKQGGYEAAPSKQTSIGMFLFWYVEVFYIILAFMDITFWQFVRYALTFFFLHYCGFEDFCYYVFEPIVKADALSGRDDPAKYYHFLWWRLPKSLYWLGKPTAEHPDAHDSLWLRFWAGNSVAGESFLLGVAVAVAIVLVPYMF